MGRPADKDPAVRDAAREVGRAVARWWAAQAPLLLAVAVIAGCADDSRTPGSLGSQPPDEREGPVPALAASGPTMSIFEDEQGQVSIRFSRPVSLEGDVYLTTNRGVSLALTRDSRAEVSGRGAEVLEWDRRGILGPFMVTGWERGVEEWSLTDREGVEAAAEFRPVRVGALPRSGQDRTLTANPTPLEVAELLTARVNRWRAGVGAPPVELGSNPVAARHALLSLAECTSSHWDIHGLKPHERYALTGGIQYVEENWGGTSSFCVTAEDLPSAPYVSGADMAKAIDDLLAAFQSSPRHTASLLDPYARYAHVGIAWDARNLKASVLLERHLVNDHPEGMFRISPAGHLTAWGSFRESVGLAHKARLRLYYEDFPAPLTRGQLARTSCYTVGRVLLAVVVSPGMETVRPADMLRPHCPDPAALEGPSAREPRSEAEGLALYRRAEQEAGQERDTVWTVPADLWERKGRAFHVEANVSPGMVRTGRFCAGRVCPGIYTLQLEVLAEGGEVVVAAQQSRWLGGRPPAAAEILYASTP